jgi:endonuclease-3
VGNERPERLARQVESTLKVRYGEARRNRLDPLDELILTVLSQNTSDANRDRAWEELQHVYSAWSEVLEDGPDRLTETIRPAGLAKQKSDTILRILKLLDGGGTPSLDHLREMPDGEALDYLTGIKGVGLKTAACVLCFSLERPIMPVDTHVHRVARRLGLVPPKATRDAAHDVLNSVVPPDLRFSLHVQLIRHGRSTCRARHADCDRCELAKVCPRVGVGDA